MNITNPFSPNTTILLPGGCSAHCPFCFWNREDGNIIPPDAYVELVKRHIASLPAAFRSLSLSGGEPTTSPYFVPILQMISVMRQYRAGDIFARQFDAVVLTTNSQRLELYLGLVGAAVDHINLSVHHYNKRENEKIFGIEMGDYKKLIALVHERTPCDVTLNCVIEPQAHPAWCVEFLNWAKTIGADAVSFRKEASEVSPTPAELWFVEKYGPGQESRCPVCRGRSQVIDDFEVRWKGSVAEPSLDTGGVYECIIRPDGLAYTDWKGTVPFPYEDEHESVCGTPCPISLATVVGGRSASGCGGRSASGCGG